MNSGAARAAVAPQEFAGFYEAVHGYQPFTWQQRLVAKLAQRLDSEAVALWDPVVDLPTGSGKTSLIDAAVFLIALESSRPSTQRRASRRIAFVVDRRVVVDQAFEHATEIAAALHGASGGGVLHRVADALRSCFGGTVDDPPLLATSLRGGVVRDETWAKRPDVPTVICSTVDQVGSRLLFRGYGISDGMKPIHAGLLGTDTLFMLDEVHLSQPFAQTLATLASKYQGWADEELCPCWEVVELSATPASEHTERFSLDSTIDLDPSTDPLLAQRMNASKPARLEAVELRSTRADKVAEKLAKHCCDLVVEMLTTGGARTVAVVVNRVATAIEAQRWLRQVLAKARPDAEVVLLTGRMRTVDRERVFDPIAHRLRTGHPRSSEDPPLIIVATQCIEAGADFDFDSLVTECASIDALIQRFGRVDRNGDLGSRGEQIGSVIIAATATVERGAEDPVYGEAMARTWQALHVLEAGSSSGADRELPEGDESLQLDFGLRVFPSHLKCDAALRAPSDEAPVLFPAHLDSWVQTSPRPVPDHSPGFWLHGMTKREADVTLVWRNDLSQALLEAAASGDPSVAHDPQEALSTIRTLLSVAPPGSMEAMTVPTPAARRWLDGRTAPPVTDVDGVSIEDDSDWHEERLDRPAVRWRGDDTDVVRPRKLRPGDIVVVPSSYGGVGEHGSWDPASTVSVSDVGDMAQLAQRRRLVLRATTQLVVTADSAQTGGGDSDRIADADSDLTNEAAAIAQDVEELDLRTVALGWLRANVERFGPTDTVIAGALLEDESKVLVQPVTLPRPGEPSDAAWIDSFVFSGKRPLSKRRADRLLASAAGRSEPGDLGAVDSEPETSSFTSVQVPLAAHLEGVGGWARMLAENCALPGHLVADLDLAGRLHDLGKADERFQRMLRDGDPRWASEPPLAKSAMPAHAYAMRRKAQQLSGYPSGTRHEVMSLAMIQHVDELRCRAHDWDLVCHLVASHHGRCRPFVPSVADDDPVSVRYDHSGVLLDASSDHGLDRLDSGVAERFWILVRRYGWYRLAWLEAILRLADHRRSEQEQQAAGDFELLGSPIENGTEALL